MPAEFVDIVIQEVDEAESYRRSGGFWEKVFKLSSDPDARWIELFDEAWSEVEQFPKRHCRVENHRLITVCLEDELTGEHMTLLTGAIGQTNARYRTPPPEQG